MTADTQLRAQVVRALRHEHLPEHINVHVEHGIVRLTGEVEHWAQRRAAEAAVLCIPGARGFLNELAVRFPVALAQPDPEVAEHVQRELAQHRELEPEHIHALVSAGWVHLTGSIESEKQRKHAERVVSAVEGVRSVTNDIAVHA